MPHKADRFRVSERHMRRSNEERNLSREEEVESRVYLLSRARLTHQGKENATSGCRSA